MADPYRDAMYRQLLDQPQTFRGAPPPALPPIFGQEFLGPKFAGMASMLMPSVMNLFQQAVGGLAGSFNGSRDLYSVYESNKYATDMTAARFKAARDDNDRIYTQFAGLNRAFNPGSVTGFDAKGRPTFSPAMEAQLRNQTDIATKMLPILSQFAPDAVDSFGGRLGLRSTAIQSFVEASRFLPNERGRAGGVDAARVADSVFKDIYADETANSVSGLRSIRVGQLFDSLVRSGNIGGGNEEQIAKKAGEAIKAHAAKIQAVNDLFTENGLDNAPMDVLMKGLEKLSATRGSASEATVAADRVRRLREATRISGLQFSELVDMRDQYDARARGLGVRAGLYGEAVHQSVAYAQAFSKLGYGDIGRSSASTLKRDEYMAADAQLRADAGASGMGNLVGAILASAGDATAGSEFANLAKSIRETGKLPAFMSGGDAMGRLSKMAEASGLSGQVFQRQVYYGRFGNIEALANETSGNALNAVRESGQSREYEAFLRAQLGGAAAAMGVGVDTLIADLRSASGEKDQAAMADAIAKKYGKAGAATQTLKTALNEASTYGVPAGVSAGSEEALKYSVQNRLRLTNPEAIKAAKEARKDMAEGANVRNALEALGRDDVGRRLFQEFAGLAQAGPVDPKREQDVIKRMSQAAARLVGVVPEAAIREQLQGMDRKALAELSDNPRTGELVDKALNQGAGAGAVGGGAGAAAHKAVTDAEKKAADNDKPTPVKIINALDLNDVGRRLFQEFAGLAQAGPVDPKREQDVIKRMSQAAARLVGVVPEAAIREQLQGMDRKALAELSDNPRTGELVDKALNQGAGAGAVGGGAGAAAHKAVTDAEKKAADNDKPTPVKIINALDLNVNISGKVDMPGGGEIRASNLNITATPRGGNA